MRSGTKYVFGAMIIAAVVEIVTSKESLQDLVNTAKEDLHGYAKEVGSNLTEDPTLVKKAAKLAETGFDTTEVVDFEFDSRNCKMITIRVGSFATSETLRRIIYHLQEIIKRAMGYKKSVKLGVACKNTNNSIFGEQRLQLIALLEVQKQVS